MAVCNTAKRQLPRWNYRDRPGLIWLVLLSEICIVLVILPLKIASAEPAKENRDESRVPPYTRPDPLVDSHGRLVKTVDDWITRRRPEILALFESQVYGRAPAEKASLKFRVAYEDDAALGGKATLKEIVIEVSTAAGKLPLRLLLFIPKSSTPMPVFLGLNFHGNQSVYADPGIGLCRSWITNDPAVGVTENRATEASRGCEASRWQVGKVISHGYAVASMCCGDIDPDYDDGFHNGVHPLFYPRGQTAPAADEWGTIAAWAWGLSRALDYLQSDPSIDAKRVAVWGHSRLGKTALWAGALDERFAMVISNCSGCGGAALSKRIFGETVGLINTRFPHWFCRNFRQYDDQEENLPVDQHELLALIAPRPLYVASASDDLEADPRGEFLAVKNAEPVYRLFGTNGMGFGELPSVDQPTGEIIRYHVRTGKHDATAYDWDQYLTFADRHLRKP
jgi:hypothetical protein